MITIILLSLGKTQLTALCSTGPIIRAPIGFFFSRLWRNLEEISLYDFMGQEFISLVADGYNFISHDAVY